VPLSRAGLAIAALGLTAGAARAACTVSTQAVAFGTYSPSSDIATDSVGGVTVTCAGLVQVNVTYTILIGGGTWGTVNDRRLGSGTARLRYQLYADLGRQTVWGDGTQGTQVIQRQTLLALLNSGANHPIYGRLFASQNVPPGTYADTLQVLVIY